MRLRLHHRYFVTILALIAAAVLLVSTALLVQYEGSMARVRDTTTHAYTEALTRQFEDRAHGLALVMAEALVNPLALLSVEGIEEVVRSVEAEPDVLTVTLYDHAGRVLFDGAVGGPLALFHEPPIAAPSPPVVGAPGRPAVHEGAGIVAATAPVRLGDQTLGAVTVRLATSRLDADIGVLLAELAAIDRAARRGRVAWLLAICALMLVLAALSTVVAARGLSRPIEVLSGLTARVGRGEYDVEVPARGRADEIGDLARSLQAMAHNLRRTTVSRDKFDLIIGSMRDGLVVTSPAGTITDANAAAARLLGRPVRDLVGRPISALVSGGEAIVALRQHDLLRAGPLDSLETTVTARDGRAVPVLLSASTMGAGGGSVQGVVCVLHDIAERKRAEAQIRYLAHHDALTGLPNRVLFRDRLHRAVAHARRAGEPLALLLLDVDHFKEVNDGLGHAVGDAVLTAVAARLRAALRESDTVARLGGDEFAIIQAGARQPDAAEALCRRLTEVVARPLRVEGHDAFVGVSIGVALCPRDGTLPDDLLRNADLALYAAKAEGRRTHRFFEGRLGARLRERKALERDLRRALARGELELHYQPQVEIATRRLIGVEALLRWHHPERGRVPPDAFIPVAERTGLIMPTGEWALRTACAQAAAWRRAGGAAAGGVRVAVNLSPALFRHRDLAALVRAVLDETGLPPHLLELEVTEGILMHGTEANLGTLNRIRGQGVRIGMDDFGTGYASLGHLRRFPFDTIKVDRSFVHDLGRGADAAAVIRTAVTLGRSLGMACLAEGVETAEQLALLRREGCREAQGDYFGAPAPAAEIGRLLAAGAPGPTMAGAG